MGPRFCKRGNPPSRPFHLVDHVLQWGHAFVSVETRLIANYAADLVQLQWGHAFVSVETL